MVSIRRKQVAVLVLLVVELDVRDTGLAEEFVALIHLDAEGAENLLGLVRLLDDGILEFFLLVIARKDCEVMVQETRI